MEVWDLLRPSLRRLTVLAVAAVVAALGAVLVEHARAAQYDGRVSVYFAQALGVDSTANSVDPTADQLTSVFKLPSVEATAATAADVPLNIVHDAALSHTAGSPIIDITVTGSREQATKAAPALAAAGLGYYAQQGVARAQSVQASATADLTAINGELAQYATKAGAPDVDAAVAAAAVAAASAPAGTTQAKEATANLARLRALQPQYDLLTTEVAGARASVSQAYSAVGAAQGVAKAVQLPGNVVTAPVKPASRITAYLRAVVGAVVVVAFLGGAYLAVTELRRRRQGGTDPAPAAGETAAPPADVPAADPDQPVPAAATEPAVVPGDFPVLASATEASATEAPEPAPVAAAVDASPVAAASEPVERADVPAPAPACGGDPYLTQAQRFVRDQLRHAGAAEAAREQEMQRRALRDAMAHFEQPDEPAPSLPEPDVDEPSPEPEVDEPSPEAAAAPAEEPIAAVHPLFAERARAQIRVLKAVPDPVDDSSDGQASAGC